MSWLTLALCLGSALRLWRCYDVDDIGQPLRNGADWLVEHLPYKLAEWAALLFSCIWCLGFWMCVALVTVGYHYGDTWYFIIPCASLSVSYLLGQLYPRVEEEDSER